MGTILVIDLGTTYFKTALFNRDGRLLDVARLAVPVVGHMEGRAELSADEFERLVAGGIQEIRDRRPNGLADVEAATFATQTNSFLLLDESDRALTPLILWPDRRAVEFEEKVRELLYTASMAARTGVPQVSHQFMAAKLLWFREHRQDIWRQAARLCLISDYLTLLLTGRHVTEAGAAGLTGLVDIHECRWMLESIAALGVPPEWLPTIVRAGSCCGTVGGRDSRERGCEKGFSHQPGVCPHFARENNGPPASNKHDEHLAPGEMGTDPLPDPSKAATLFGLPGSCLFIVGCLDQYAGAIGAGNVMPGGVSETTGTVLATVRCADHFNTKLPPGVFQGPAFAPDRYFQMVFGDCSANYLEWYRNQLPNRPDFDCLIAMAETVPPGAEGLRIDPQVRLTTAGGGQSPFRQVSEPRNPCGEPSGYCFQGEMGTVFGSETVAGYTTGQVVRCILEGVGSALREQVATLCGPDLPEEIRSVGGATRSSVWLQIKADVLGIGVRAINCPEPTSLGAAILAEASLRGIDVPTIAGEWVRPAPPHRPDPEAHRRHQELGL